MVSDLTPMHVSKTQLCICDTFDRGLENGDVKEGKGRKLEEDQRRLRLS